MSTPDPNYEKSERERTAKWVTTIQAGLAKAGLQIVPIPHYDESQKHPFLARLGNRMTSCQFCPYPRENWRHQK